MDLRLPDASDVRFNHDSYLLSSNERGQYPIANITLHVLSDYVLDCWLQSFVYLIIKTVYFQLLTTSLDINANNESTFLCVKLTFVYHLLLIQD